MLLTGLFTGLLTGPLLLAGGLLVLLLLAGGLLLLLPSTDLRAEAELGLAWTGGDIGPAMFS